MDKQLYDALEVCMAAMRTGVDTDNCLALYPHIASELRAALEGAQYAGALHLSDVPTIPLRRSRVRLQKRVALLEDRKRWLFPTLQFPHTTFIALLVVFVLALSWKSLLVVSAKSLPGDGLYPVKRALESVALTFFPVVETRHEIEDLTNPAGYIQAVEIHSRYFALIGKVEEIDQTIWVIAGRKIRLLPGDQIDPSLQVGDRALTLVYSDDQGGLSTRAVIQLSEAAIEFQLQKDPSALLEAVNLEGEVSSMSADHWTVADRNVTIVAKTEIRGEISAGGHVLVQAWQFMDGTLVAGEIVEAGAPGIDQEKREEIKASGSAGANSVFETIPQKGDSGENEVIRDDKGSSSEGESSVKDLEETLNDRDSDAILSNNSSDDKQDISGNTSSEENHEEHSSTEENDTGE